MRRTWVIAAAATCLVSIVVTESKAADHPPLEAMPPDLETRYALSAAPPRLREAATVYLLNPKTGYHLAKQGTSGVTCIVQRTDWDMPELRDDVYWSVCYDAAGTKTYLKTIMDAAELRTRGMNAAQIKAEIAKRYRDKSYTPPQKVGVSYMVSPIMRAVGPPDMQVHTMAMPHLMFYAPFVTNTDIGASPDFNDPSSLTYPFLDKHTEGGTEHGYIIQILGETEKAKIMKDEQTLVDDLCAYRDVLCLESKHH